MPFIFLYFAFRCTFDRAYRNFFGDRLAHLPAAFERTAANSIWLHAVSLGEIISAVSLIRRLRDDRPGVPIYVSTSTVAGRYAAKQHLSTLATGVFYVPLDFGITVRKVLNTIRPALLIVLETEIWPSLYFEAHRCGVAVVVVNGRISARTWPRYKALAWFFQPLLQIPQVIFAQTDGDAERYKLLGARSDRVRLVGNLKYDVASQAAPAGLNTFGATEVWIAASTVGPNERGSVEKHNVDEDDIVLRAFRNLMSEFPRLLLVLAPRQPARFDIVAQKLECAGVPFVRRSQGDCKLQLPGVLLLDTIGELASWYNVADVAFVGGSLAPRGGHNVLEPAFAGVPVLTGPHMQNFEPIARDLIQGGGLLQLAEEHQLEPAVTDLLRDPAKARKMGEAGRATVCAKAGVAERIAASLWNSYDHAFPVRARSWPRRALYGALARIWMKSAERRRAQAERERDERIPLPVPVISIGSVSVGGSGKTPLADRLSRQLRLDGWSPAILTRGYRRRSTADHIILAPGTLLPPAYTGDEAHIFLRAANAALGIGSDRYRTAELLLQQFPQTDVIVLDDGFQHARMPRDIDILVIDGMDPWAGDTAVPLGRLREPLDLLKRASMIVVTRADDAFRYASIRERLYAIAGKDIPVFRSITRPLGWRDALTSEPLGQIGHAKTAAFCGLGNPANFWQTLNQLGLDPVFRSAFPDHHHYRPTEINGLLKSAGSHGASWLLTTQKDCNNLPEGMPASPQGVRLAWLDIELVIEDENGFFSDIKARLGRR